MSSSGVSPEHPTYLLTKVEEQICRFISPAYNMKQVDCHGRANGKLGETG
jgi:hypothetical protein